MFSAIRILRPLTFRSIRYTFTQKKKIKKVKEIKFKIRKSKIRKSKTMVLLISINLLYFFNVCINCKINLIKFNTHKRI